MEGYLNELSLRTYSNREEVKKTLMRLNQTIAKLKSLGVSTIRTDGSLDSHQFLDGISFLRLLKDEEVIDKDLKGVLLATFETLDPVDFVTDKHLILEMKVNGNSCKGLGWASEKLEDTVAISFPLSDWENSSYTVSITQLMENDEDELIEDTVSSSTRNIISEVQCEQHRFFLEKNGRCRDQGKHYGL